MTDYIALARDAVADIEEREAPAVSAVARLIAMHESDLRDAVDDKIAEMKGYFGSLAANQVDDAEASAATAGVEQWITDNISNGSPGKQAAGILTMFQVENVLSEFEATVVSPLSAA